MTLPSDVREKVKKIDGKNVKVRTMANMFSGCTNLTGITDVATWDTSAVLYMHKVFQGVSVLKDLSPLGTWNTSSVQTFYQMFDGLTPESLDFTN